MDSLKAQRRKTRKAAERAQKNRARAKARRERRCFWSWPLGHEWVDVGSDEHPNHRCISCDKPRYTLPEAPHPYSSQHSHQ